MQSSSDSSLVFEVKEKQDRDLSLVKIKESVQNQKVEIFSQGGMVFFVVRVIYVFQV